MQQSYSGKLQKIYADRNRLAAFLRPLHRLLTGVPDEDAPLLDTTPMRLFFMDIGWLFMFMAIAATGASLFAGGGWLAPLSGLVSVIGVLGTIGRLRRLVVGHVHEATHGVVAKFYRARGESKRLARRKAEAILDIGTALTFTLNGQAYRRYHARHHRISMLGTRQDPDGQELYEWGVWPTKTDNLYLSLALRAIDPLWHASFFFKRIKTNLFERKAYRRAAGAASLAALSFSAFFVPAPIWIAAVLIPFGPGYHIASLLQVITEHRYGYERDASSVDEMAARTWERVPYALMPETKVVETPLVWLKWIAKNTLHAVTRLAILDETMIGHGYHHLAWPVGRPFNDWWNTMPHFIEAYRDGALPKGQEGRIVEGLVEALQRQRLHFRKERAIAMKRK